MNEVSHTEKDKYKIILIHDSLKNGTNESVHLQNRSRPTDAESELKSYQGVKQVGI